MSDDVIEQAIGEWQAIRADADTTSAELMLRVLLLGRSLEQRIARSLEPFGLHMWEFDVLSALRRAGSPYTLSAGELARRVVMTCSGMTHRVTRLQERGFVRRTASESDRRSIFVTLTEAGLDCVDRAMTVRMHDNTEIVASLPQQERVAMVAGLKRLSAALDE